MMRYDSAVNAIFQQHHMKQKVTKIVTVLKLTWYRKIKTVIYSWYVFRQKRSLPHILQHKTGIYDTDKSQLQTGQDLNYA